MTALNDRGVLVQEGLEWPFDPKLRAPSYGRVAGSPESTQAEMGKQIEAAEDSESTLAAMGKQIEAAESTQGIMRKHIEAWQRELAAVQDSVTAKALEHSYGG